MLGYKKSLSKSMIGHKMPLGANMMGYKMPLMSTQGVPQMTRELEQNKKSSLERRIRK
jgi:hypothetical protein